MGQYYKAVILGKRGGVVAHFSPYNYGHLQGAKLKEHSYIGNEFCNAVENFLKDNPHRLVWAGDYADTVKGKDGNYYYLASKKPSAEIFDGNQADLSKDLFVINHTKKLYYQRSKVPAFDEGWYANPLPILTAQGNGRGGGDYKGVQGEEYVGTWAGDEIEVSISKPSDYEEMVYFFKYW